jgi:hypothetical protein
VALLLTAGLPGATGMMSAELAAAHESGAGAAPARILYAGDWNGPMQIFAVDPSGRAPVGQVTFDHPTAVCSWSAACGFSRPLPSPDGRRLAYWTASEHLPQTLWLARGDGARAHAVGPASDADWAPDSRRLAYVAGEDVHVLSVTGGDRIVYRGGYSVRWSPDGRTLAIAAGWRGLVLLRAGRARVLLPETPSSFDWAPDGKRIAYATRTEILQVTVTSGRTKRLCPLPNTPILIAGPQLAYAPDGRLLAYTGGGPIGLLDTTTRRLRTLPVAGHDLGWSPDGRSLLYVQGREDPSGDSITTGDLQTVTPAGQIRTVVPAAGRYGGQIVSAAWVRPAPGIRYRAPEQVSGVYAGGPVRDLAADGGRVAFVACGGLSTWTPATGSVTTLAPPTGPPGTCLGPLSRTELYSTAVAGDRIAWVDKQPGLCFLWTVHQATLGNAPLAIGHGGGCLGVGVWNGMATAVGSGSLLVVSTWSVHPVSPSHPVDEQTIVRVERDGSLVPLSSNPGPYTPLDVEGGRIVAGGENETRVLDENGGILLSLPLPTQAAQLSGPNLVVAAGGRLLVYDAESGALRAAWPLPAPLSGHVCGYFEPACVWPWPPLILVDAARDLAAYVFGGQVHLLRLTDGADRRLGVGTIARFTDEGLAYADGARIRLTPFSRLPLR